MPLLYHAYVYLEFLILACTIYILAPMQEQSKAELAILTYHAAKSLGISALYISEDLEENYGAYDLIYKYRPEKKEFSIIDYRA